MSTSRNFIRFVHKVDLYTKVSSTNDMGQLHASWNLFEQDIECFYVRARASTDIRIEPSTVETDYYLIYFNHDAPIDYNTRFKNIRTYVGNEVISNDWIQIIQIDKEISFTGRVQYLQVKVKNVIE
jgi:hypothetical protein